MKKLLFAVVLSACASLIAEAKPKLVLHMDFNTAQRTKSAVISLLREAAAMGYNAVLWEIEDKVKWALPEIAAPDAFTKEEFREILAEADRLGMEPIPLLQVFGHGEYVLSKKPYVGLREKADEPDCYCVSKPETFEFQKKFIAEYLELFGPKVRWFHLGGDEAYGFGKCPVCSKRGKMDLYLWHLDRVSALLETRGIRAGVWHDMVCGDAWWQKEGGFDAAKAPRKYLVWMWDYLIGYIDGKTPTYADKIPLLQKLGFDIVFAGATSSFNDGPFLPGMKHHRLNLAKGAAMAREQKFAAFCVTSWTIRQNLRAVQMPLFRFAAKRYLDPADDVAADWSAALRACDGVGLAADELDVASEWGENLTRFDGRAFSLYKDGATPTQEDFRKRIAEKKATGKIPSEAKVKPILAALRKGMEKGCGVWREAYELEYATLNAIDCSVRDRPFEPLRTAEAVRHLSREQSPKSAAESTAIIWGFFPQR